MEVHPPLAEYPGGHLAACHHPRNVSAAEISAATRSPLSPLSSGQLMPGGEQAPTSGTGESQVTARTGGTAEGPDEEP
jgi:peptide/nickel transport system ATP-binding protein/oligopeptide transport system ATP-binding protein